MVLLRCAHGGLDYCVNSTAFRLIRANDLARDGYGAYRRLFQSGEQHYDREGKHRQRPPRLARHHQRTGVNQPV